MITLDFELLFGGAVSKRQKCADPPDPDPQHSLKLDIIKAEWAKRIVASTLAAARRVKKWVTQVSYKVSFCLSVS